MNVEISSRTVLHICRRLRLALASLPVLLACALAGTAAHAQTVQYSVEINGAGPLTGLLNENLDIERHAANADLSADELQRLYIAAPKQMRDLLATEGYFSPLITSTLRHDAAREVMQFTVDPGAPTLIARVDLQFTGAVAQGDPQRLQDLRSAWLLKVGERFRQADWNAAKSALLKGLLIRDYPAAKIAHSSAEIDPQSRSAKLQVQADSGPAFTFGALQIQGLQRYSRAMIEALNPLHEGEPYSQDKLTELQARLQDSGYFRTVFATIDVDPARPQNVPVRVDLVENERRRLSLGGGYSTDGGARLQAKWLDRRFLDHDWRLDSELRFDQKTQVIGGELAFPARASGWRPSLGSHFERTDITNEINDRFRIDARYGSPSKLNERVWGVSYLADRQIIPDTSPNNRQALVANWALTRRRVDNLVTPTRGYVASLELAAGPRGLFNQANLARFDARLNWLSPVVQRWQLVLRGEIGQVLGAGRALVPGDLLFRTGGDQSVRGYAYNSLGVAQNGAIVGGRVLGVLSAEAVYQITPLIGAAVFHDAGNAADHWQDFRLQQGSGIGARIRTPIGPVNLDLAFAHATRQPRLHFSVGYGF